MSVPLRSSPNLSLPNHGSSDRQKRQVVSLAGTAAFADGSTARITVLDLTVDGAKIASSVAMSKGLALELDIDRIGRLNAEVRWARDGNAGLRFCVEPEPEGEQVSRQAERSIVNATAMLRRSTAKAYSTNVFDFSPLGCKLEFVERPAVGELVYIKFDGLESMEGEIRWVEGSCAGVQFVRPIHASVFDMVISKLNLH